MSAVKKRLRADMVDCAQKIANDKALRKELSRTAKHAALTLRRRARSADAGRAEQELVQYATTLLGRVERLLGLEPAKPVHHTRRNALVGLAATLGAVGVAIAARQSFGTR
jgi:hypothetical protein